MSEDTLTRPALNLAVFKKAAELIRANGFWDGVHNESRSWNPNAMGYCIGLAITEQKNGTASADKDDAMDHLAAQLGYTDKDPLSAQGFVFRKNDEFVGRREEGKAWALDVLDKLARGESL